MTSVGDLATEEGKKDETGDGTAHSSRICKKSLLAFPFS
jgi:hypothetical protein